MSIGHATTRIEGRAKLTGAAKYAADIYPDNLLHAVLVGSPVAAGRVRSLDTSAASAISGVTQIVTHENATKLGKTDRAGVTHIPLQTTDIEWEGQTVAVVLAESLEAGEEAAALVRVVVDSVPAAIPGEGRLDMPQTPMPLVIDGKMGDPQSGYARAEVLIEQTYSQPTRHHNPMETSSCVAQWDGDRLTLWDSVQFSLDPVVVMAGVFAIDSKNIRVISPHTGGGFGVKSMVWPHEILTAQLAQIARRPVRLHLTRAQMYEMCSHQAECTMKITLGADRDGKLTIMRHDSVNTTAMSDMHFEPTAMATMSAYACPAIEVKQRVERVNFLRPAPMRAPVEGPGSWALESAMDELAHKIGIDPLDLRLKNFAESEPFHGKPWSSNKLREAYAEAAEAFGWRRRADMAKQDGNYIIGRGMAMGTMFCARFPGQARIRLRSDGQATVEASVNDIGTGSQTVAALVAAEALGVDPSRIDIRWGDTNLPKAGPVYGSSQTMGLGSAVKRAAGDARRKLTLLGAPATGFVDFSTVLTNAGVAEILGEGAFTMPDGAPASISGSGTPFAMQTWGANFVEVGVDRDLGVVRLRRAVARYSAGRIINPLTARSQMIGAIIWEWGKATMEASIVEPTYARFLAKNLSNVAVPVNADIAESAIDVGFVDEYDQHASDIGARGIGELGCCGVAAAIANAVFDAVGLRVRRVPILPHHVIEHFGGDI